MNREELIKLIEEDRTYLNDTTQRTLPNTIENVFINGGIFSSMILRLSTKHSRKALARVINRVLIETIKLENGDNNSKHYRVKDAQDNISILMREARAGHSLLVGGFRKNEEPVVMISVDQLTALIDNAIEKHSMADLLPSDDERPPLTDNLKISIGTPSFENVIKLD